MNSRAAALLALLALLLAGCTHPAAAPQPSSSTSSTHSATTTSTAPAAGNSVPVANLLLAFSMAPCQGITVLASKALADVQALLPDGFTVAPSPYDSTGTTAAIGVDLYACGNLTTPAARVANTYYGQTYTYVKRPDGRVPDAPDAATQEYVFRVLASTDILATSWPAAGYDTYNGTASVQVGSPAQLPADTGQRVGQGGVGAGYSLIADATQGPIVSVANTAAFARYTVLGDHSVLVWTGKYDFPQAAGGQGFAQVDASDPFAKVQGHTPGLVGLSRIYESGGMVGMDLRRVFT